MKTCSFLSLFNNKYADYMSKSFTTIFSIHYYLCFHFLFCPIFLFPFYRSMISYENLKFTTKKGKKRRWMTKVYCWEQITILCNFEKYKIEWKLDFIFASAMYWIVLYFNGCHTGLGIVAMKLTGIFSCWLLLQLLKFKKLFPIMMPLLNVE